MRNDVRTAESLCRKPWPDTPAGLAEKARLAEMERRNLENVARAAAWNERHKDDQWWRP